MTEPNAEFDRYAENYEDLLRDPMRERFVRNADFFHRRKWILIADFLKRNGISAQKAAWLDVGCGKGELLGYGCRHFGHAAGCDLSREMVRNSAAGAAIHLQESADALPFPDSSYDVVTAVCVYHHVEERCRIPLTREIGRVLRANGVFCMIEHNPFNPVTRLIVSRTPVDADARLLTLSRGRKYAEAAGLRYVDSEYFLYVPESYYGRFGRLEKALTRLPLGGQYAIFFRKDAD
jgi:SAM-dependent methyltransferase